MYWHGLIAAFALRSRDHYHDGDPGQLIAGRECRRYEQTVRHPERVGNFPSRWLSFQVCTCFSYRLHDLSAIKSTNAKLKYETCCCLADLCSICCSKRLCVESASQLHQWLPATQYSWQWLEPVCQCYLLSSVFHSVFSVCSSCSATAGNHGCKFTTKDAANAVQDSSQDNAVPLAPPT